jgi:signal-transduction protein with cAMP-binding, CBS, and nucleotidyltransferase domain
MVDARDLEKISLFEGLNDAERKVVASVMTCDTFPEGHVVYRENEVGSSCIYIVRKGKVDVTRMNTDSNPLPLTILKEETSSASYRFSTSGLTRPPRWFRCPILLSCLSTGPISTG